MPGATSVPLDEFSAPAPKLTPVEAEAVAERQFGVTGVARPLSSERDQNFLIQADDGRAFVLKVANPGEDRAIAEMQVEALLHIARVDPELPVPRVRPTIGGAPIGVIRGPAGDAPTVRMVTFLEGVTRPAREFGPDAVRSLGRCGARLGRALRGFFHPAAGRTLIWDLQRAAALAPLLSDVADPSRRALAARVLERFPRRVAPALPCLRAQVIHNDLQADNVVVLADGGSEIAGVIDFGDLVFAPLVCDLAVTSACMSFGRADPFEAVLASVDGYTSVTPLEPSEIELLPDLVSVRLSAWVLIAAWRARRHPDNAPYIENNQEEAWEALGHFEKLGATEAERRIREVCRGLGPRSAPAGAPDGPLLARRQRVIAPTLRLSYDERPLHPVRGEGVWLYDAAGRAYLDAYNNVPVVGHGHPRVVEALARQAALLNANSRYLHEALVELAERLVATMPEGLDTCFFLSSGSEANDLAWRLAREAGGNTGAIVTEFAYHGVTMAAADLSPEEWPEGRHPECVAAIPAPDTYRSPHGEDDADWALRSASHLDDAIARLRRGGFGLAAGYVDPSFASDGIFFPPAAYLREIARRTRAAGGLLVADEVQAGFGRTGEHLWGFAASGVTPDFVTLGKPMGNGHPVAALVTRADIVSASAARRPEFFSTFGGNSVAAAVALAVLDVIEDEGLRTSALAVGAYLLDQGLRALAARHESIGDVRGAGLMVGVELVRDRGTREPAASAARAVVNAMRDRGVLIGRCGPRANVLKIRPPLVFSRAHADRLIEVLDEVLATCP